MSNNFQLMMSKIAKATVEAQDDAVKAMLERNGISLKTNNIEDMKKLLSDNGYVLDMVQNDNKTETTYRLLKLQDSIKFTINYNINTDVVYEDM